MKKLRTLAAIMICTALFTGCTAQASPTIQGDKPLVLASFYTMSDFTAKIGGDRIQVVNLVPTGTEPHDWEPTAQDMAYLESADLLVLNGVGLEHWVDDIMPTLQNKDLTVVDTSLPVSTFIESDFDPHIWLNPLNAKLQMDAIRAGLIEIDPDGADVYNKNYDTYAARCEALDAEYRDTLSPLPGKEIVVAHQAFSYLCAQYGLTQLSVQGLSPVGEPDPAQMAQVIAYSNEHRVKVIFFEEMTSPKVAETIARETGSTTAVLSPIEGLSDEQVANGDDYFSVMEQNLQQLKVALS